VTIGLAGQAVCAEPDPIHRRQPWLWLTGRRGQRPRSPLARGRSYRGRHESGAGTGPGNSGCLGRCGVARSHCRGDGKKREHSGPGRRPTVCCGTQPEVLAGRFFDDLDSMSREKAAVVSQKFAQRVYATRRSQRQEHQDQRVPFTISALSANGRRPLGSPKLPTTPF